MSHNILRAGIMLPTLLLLNFFPLSAETAAGSDDETDDALLFTDDDGITVTGTPQVSQQMAVVDKEEIERRNAPDLASLLQETLDVNIVRYGAYGNQTLINLRGLDSKRVAFLIDGVPADSGLDGKFDISQIDLNSVERIEIIYGGSDSKYNVSGAMGGVVNIITIKKQKPGLRIGASASNVSVMPGEYRNRREEKQDPHWEDLADTQNYTLSAAYGKSAFSVSANAFANRAENHFTFTDSYNRIRRKDNNEVWDAGAAARAVWGLADLSKLIASANFYYGDKNFPSSGFSSNVGKQNDIFTRHNLMLDMPRAFRDDLAAEATLGWHFARIDYDSPADIRSRHDQNSLNAINRWNWYPADLLVLRSGIDYRFINLDSTEIGRRNRHDGGIYLAAEYRPIKQFLVVPSIKAAFTSKGTPAVTPIPKLGLVWYAADSFTLKNNYFRSFKFPDFEELYWGGGGGAGNPDLKPEDGWGGDIGAEWRITDKIKMENVFFTHWLKDSIHWYAGGGGVWRPENVGEAIFFGLHNNIKFNIPVAWGAIRKIVPSVSYQYLLSYLLSFGYDFASDKRIPYSPEHTVGGTVEIAWEKGSVLISGHYESLRYHDRDNSTELEPYFLLDAAVNQKIGKSLSAFGVLRNILNESYESFYNYPMPGINLTVGVKLNVEVRK